MASWIRNGEVLRLSSINGLSQNSVDCIADVSKLSIRMCISSLGARGVSGGGISRSIREGDLRVTASWEEQNRLGESVLRSVPRPSCAFESWYCRPLEGRRAGSECGVRGN